MAKNERYFLNGIIRALKPKKILEVGVANGGGSAIILNAISDIDGADLYSVDYLEYSYRHPDKTSGFLVEDKFPQFMNKWHIFRGGDISCFIEEIGGDIDLLVLDTSHTHPWETLNFLCVLPFMRIESLTVLHDITMQYARKKARSEVACRYLFSHVVSDEKFSPVPDHEGLLSNIGAFKVSEAALKYVNTLFESLLIPWGTEVKPEDMETISAIIRKYYSPEQYKFFCDALNFQEYIKQCDDDYKADFYPSLKIFLKSWQPGLFKLLKRILKGK